MECKFYAKLDEVYHLYVKCCNTSGCIDLCDIPTFLARCGLNEADARAAYAELAERVPNASEGVSFSNIGSLSIFSNCYEYDSCSAPGIDLISTLPSDLVNHVANGHDERAIKLGIELENDISCADSALRSLVKGSSPRHHHTPSSQTSGKANLYPLI